MFALGGVQPAVKLAAFSGMPGTKAIGLTWVVSWVVVEILGSLARDIDFGPDGNGSLTLEQHAAWVSFRKTEAVKDTQERLISSSKHIAWWANGLLCLWMMQDVIFGAFYRNLKKVFLFKMSCLGFQAIWLSTELYRSRVIGDPKGSEHHGGEYIWIGMSKIVLIGGLYGVVGVGILYVGFFSKDDMSWYDFGVLFQPIFPVAGAAWVPDLMEHTGRQQLFKG